MTAGDAVVLPADARADGRVALVVASRNRCELLLQTLSRHLMLPERPQVIVVDDASTDGTADAVSAAFPEVSVIRLPRSLGGAARNVGMRALDVPYVAFSDDDSWWSAGALARAESLLDRHPRLAAVSAHVLVGSGERVDPLCEEMARTPLAPAEGQPGYPLLSFLAGAVVVRRGAVLAAGGFCERLRVGGEEELLAWDLVGAGWQISYMPDVVAHHDPPPHDGRPGRRELGIRNTLWTTWLRRPPRAAVVRTVRQLRRCPPDRFTVRAVIRALAGLPWVLRERRVSPPHVEHMRRLLEAQQLNSRARRYI
jgi:GT2 family glycosyltransferase